MTNKEASNVLRLFANLIEINGLPQERIMTFRKVYEQAITKLESDERPQGEWIRKYNGHRADICCTNCGYDEGYSCFKYCPNCGAEMNGAIYTENGGNGQ